MAYLTLFEDFEVARRYSWGAATLSFLYRELTQVCHTRVVGIAGCLNLMQVERPTDECYKPWWKPGAIQDKVGPPTELSGRRIWLSRTPLICFEIVELHVPDRVMLQFGLEQVTPLEDVEHVTRVSRKGRAGEDWAVYHRDYIARCEARAESVVTGSRASPPDMLPERSSIEMCHMLVSLLTWSSQPEIEHHGGVVQGVGLQLRRQPVSRIMTRFQPYRSLRCPIFHLSRLPSRSPTSPLSSQRSLSPAATLPFRGFIQEGKKRQLVH
ncbi:hypothetical protein H6P81_010465 [Aristolochia fimbriata]|uniref:Aminotransferase-like plant mobile domain-containing protein n=1 Tax=Aristolochia fimbriata TaxID=158543 RepID=A0AAV7ENU6_ARIFI|nr:hypothetical protein H6P81_010465 [Aristolochia fimbriata]